MALDLTERITTQRLGNNDGLMCLDSSILVLARVPIFVSDRIDS